MLAIKRQPDSITAGHAPEFMLVKYNIPPIAIGPCMQLVMQGFRVGDGAALSEFVYAPSPVGVPPRKGKCSRNVIGVPSNS